jgi:hypothetical protein
MEYWGIAMSPNRSPQPVVVPKVFSVGFAICYSEYRCRLTALLELNASV